MDANSIPGYTIKKKLGAGAMAAVFLAREKKLDRNVALKVMSEKLVGDPSFAQRFLREARIVASISHRNIVTVFDVGSHGPYHYMAMEYLPGGNLSKKLKEGISLRQAISHVMDIAEGLHYAASKNFIHRDIKPDNIMFGEDGRAVITDFGIARSTASETSMTMVGSIIGTPQYMSPEQASAEALDHRTDLYSLGIILYEILTGAPPFKGDSAISTGVMHITQPVPLLPPEFEQFQYFIDVALAKDPEDRFQTGHEFIDALAQIDLDAYEGYEAATELISPEDLAEALGTSGFHSGMQSGLGSHYPSGLNSGQASSAGSFVAHEPKKKLSGLAITAMVMFALLASSLFAHTLYVNVLGKSIPFNNMAKGLGGVLQMDLSGMGAGLELASTGLASVTGAVFSGLAPAPSTALSLNPEETRLLDALDLALREGRFYFPPFDCAELYLNDFRELGTQPTLAQQKTNELVSLSLDRAYRLLDEGKVDDADALVLETKRILPLVDDKALLLRHRQISSSIIIAR